MESYNTFNNYDEQNSFNKYENIKERINIFMDDVKDNELKRHMQETVKKLENLEK